MTTKVLWGVFFGMLAGILMLAPDSGFSKQMTSLHQAVVEVLQKVAGE